MKLSELVYRVMMQMMIEAYWFYKC